MNTTIVSYAKRAYSHYIKINSRLSVKLEKIKGIDFTQEHSLEELCLSNDNSESYQTAGSYRIKRILLSMSITEDDSIVDFGCGKGRILYLMSKFPFKHVDGVEISVQLCDIAKRNMQKLNVKTVEIFNSNASAFKDIDKYNYFYFFNPFPAKVMIDVMKNIEKSLAKVPRTLTIIYFNPVCHEEIIKSGTFARFKNKWNVSLYKNKNL